MLRCWNFLLVCLIFFFIIFGIFLIRSQFIVFIYVFADSNLSEYFFFYMVFIVIVCIGFLGWRWL